MAVQLGNPARCSDQNALRTPVHPDLGAAPRSGRGAVARGGDTAMKTKSHGPHLRSRGPAHVEERYSPCVDGSRYLSGAPDRDVKYGDAVTAKKFTLTSFNSGRRYFRQA